MIDLQDKRDRFLFSFSSSNVRNGAQCNEL